MFDRPDLLKTNFNLSRTTSAGAFNSVISTSVTFNFNHIKLRCDT